METILTHVLDNLGLLLRRVYLQPFGPFGVQKR
jgi:hypothetical protein